MNRRAFLKGGAIAMFGAGTAPAWLARAAGANLNGRRKVLVALFQRGAADGLNIVIPHGEEAYYSLRPTIAVPKTEVDRPRRSLRPASLFGSAEKALGFEATRDCTCGRLSRPDPVTFRCPGLYGIGHSRAEIDR